MPGRYLETWEDVDYATTAVNTIFNSASSQRKQGVILTASDVVTGMEVGTALANNDFTGVDKLTTESLYTKTLRVGVATVTGARRTFLMCHVRGLLSCGDRRDLDRRKFRTVTLTTAVAGLVLVTKDVNLWTTVMIYEFAFDARLCKHCSIGCHCAVIDQQQNWQRHFVAGLTHDAVELNQVAYRNLFLAPASTNNRVHRDTP